MMAHIARRKRTKVQGGDVALRKASKKRRQLGRQLNSRGNGFRQFSPHPNPLPKGEGTKRKELAPVESRPRNLPLWVPEGVDLDFVPVEVQQAARELVQPLYDQFVIGTADGLEKSLGVTISHLLWLEILEQFDIKREYTQVEAVLNLAGNRAEMIDRHLHLIDSKLRVGYFLVRISEMRKRIAEQAKIGPQVISELSGNATMGLILDAPTNIENPPTNKNDAI